MKTRIRVGPNENEPLASGYYKKIRVIPPNCLTLSLIPTNLALLY